MSYTAIDNQLWTIKLYLMKKHGCRAGEALFAPLEWYISTGRASADFLRWFVSAKAFVIGRLLAKGGSYDEAVARLKAKAGC